MRNYSLTRNQKTGIQGLLLLNLPGRPVPSNSVYHLIVFLLGEELDIDCIWRDNSSDIMD